MNYKWNKHEKKITPEIIIIKLMKNSKIENKILKAARERQYIYIHQGGKIRVTDS